MTKIYYNRIKLGLLTIEDVPAKYKTQVEELLNADK